MRSKGKLIKWNEDKAFGFIAPNGGEQVFIHKKALINRHRTPQINDVITFSLSKDRQGRICADQATFSGEKLKIKAAKKMNRFSIYLSVVFITSIIIFYLFEYFPQKLIFLYIGASAITFLVYASDKSKAKRKVWRTPESSLHMLALIGGWPGAAIAQQVLRHKSQKKEFRRIFWLTVFVNLAVLVWLFTPKGQTVLQILG
ncbi:DUF1294 domain-containing protein [Colwellia sp. 4_MG-2023]|uniref:DUF1294 domain-containing protein n=1 Tax=unclassified Colwellia TaxID=196834 RepID=UPI0026E3CB30|nr:MULTISPECIES: DUF1294 domain-containing protein [unclassified Colwellia]MDO6505376.1 DUF1294 domain-containing protein [Colwellia sp. 5_MG-2023]MDO6554328.1 DUF1294 domain-containing protein [Colwellia sp. 4_MG-2023]